MKYFISISSFERIYSIVDDSERNIGRIQFQIANNISYEIKYGLETRFETHIKCRYFFFLSFQNRHCYFQHPLAA